MGNFEGIGLQTRWGDGNFNPTYTDLKNALDELKQRDDEHSETWISNDYEDVLSVNQDLVVKFYNFEDDKNILSKQVDSLQEAYDIWVIFCEGDIDKVKDILKGKT